MNNVWFSRLGWIYRPVTWQGFLVSSLALGFCVQVFLAIDRHSHSVSDTLYKVFPYFACCFLMVIWVASNTCGKDRP